MQYGGGMLRSSFSILSFSLMLGACALGGSLLAPNEPQHLLAVCPEIRPSQVTYYPLRDGRKATPGLYFTGANFDIRRSVAMRVGPYDE